MQNPFKLVVKGHPKTDSYYQNPFKLAFKGNPKTDSYFDKPPYSCKPASARRAGQARLVLHLVGDGLAVDVVPRSKEFDGCIFLGIGAGEPGCAFFSVPPNWRVLCFGLPFTPNKGLPPKKGVEHTPPQTGDGLHPFRRAPPCFQVPGAKSGCHPKSIRGKPFRCP